MFTLFRWGNVVLIFCTFLAYLSPYINPTQFWIPSFVGLAYPWLLLLNFLFIIFWLLFKKKYFLFSLACIILGWGHLTSFLGLSLFSGSSTGKEIRVMTYNMNGTKNSNYEEFARKKAKKIKIDVPFLSFLKKNGPYDIMCFQESLRFFMQPIADHLGLEHVFVKIKPGIGTSIISRYPILNSGGFSFKNSLNSFVWIDVEVNNKKLRIYSIHLQSNRVSEETDKVIKKGDIKDKKTWLDIKSVLTKIKRSTQKRIAQAEIIADHMNKSPYPVIVCGDFNDSPQSYAYQIIAKNLKDTFQEKGFGLGSTYAGNIPALRIDYILTDKKLKTLDCSIIKEKHSDHYPVVSTISID